LNLGGIANITIIPAQRGTPLRGFDTGPASCLMDAWAQRHVGTPYDADGAFAQRGKADVELLEHLLRDPYFAASPPKSTGREVFHLTWPDAHLRGRDIAAQDVQNTLLHLTVRSIADAVRAHAPAAREVVVCGGGVHNPVLMSVLAAHLSPAVVASSAARG